MLIVIFLTLDKDLSNLEKIKLFCGVRNDETKFCLGLILNRIFLLKSLF